MSDITPRFTADEARVLLDAAKWFRKNLATVFTVPSKDLDGAIRALIVGQSCPDPMVVLQVGSVPPWFIEIPDAGWMEQPGFDGAIKQAGHRGDGRPNDTLPLYRLSSAEGQS